MPLSPFKQQKGVGYALLIVVAVSALLTGINAEVQREQSNHLDKVVSCQANVNKRLFSALNDRDKLSADTQNNLDTLIKGLTEPSKLGEEQQERIARAARSLATYFAEAKKINDRRQSITLPSTSEITACE